ncbi:uncharacterized protein LOC124717077 isoform X4 [Schistocerca piceifrons]|uniref:uncharacterized protein LOC124717077 isoform X4 n=1 Tax=Schistocerca piceifrons TaxID=274613 RepID=UPI001F5E7E89|nr:uncharacterized protein LOC124717077 isoform X4 [Schistocerca piceifrons]XP_047099722.1 uncharacterized protein LOC124717077 isoform X4 [Schistocerca piceifrons]
MKTAQGEHRSSVCGVTVVKHESVEAVPLTFPKQEMELLSVKEEPLDWEVPDGHVSTQEPLNVVKEACSPSDDCLGPRTLNTRKTEDDKDEEAMSEDDFVVVKHEVESVGSDSEQERDVFNLPQPTGHPWRSLSSITTTIQSVIGVIIELMMSPRICSQFEEEVKPPPRTFVCMVVAEEEEEEEEEDGDGDVISTADIVEFNVDEEQRSTA